MSNNNEINLPNNFCSQGFNDCLFSLTHNETILGTLIGGLLTIFGVIIASIMAWLTIKEMRRQISLQEKFERDKLIRLAKLIRSKMPSKLAMVIEWIENLEKSQLELLNYHNDITGYIDKENITIPEHRPFPKELEEYSGEVIMYLEKDKLEKIFIYLLRVSQLYDTRTIGLEEDINDNSLIILPHNIYYELSDYRILLNLICSVFPYSRYETDEIPIAKISKVNHLFHYRGFHHAERTCLEVNKILETRLKRKDDNSLSEISDLIE